MKGICLELGVRKMLNTRKDIKLITIGTDLEFALLVTMPKSISLIVLKLIHYMTGDSIYGLA